MRAQSTLLRNCGTGMLVISVAAMLASSVIANADGGSRRRGNYLIVTPPAYDGSAPLTQLANDRASKGFTVATYSVPSGTSRTVIKEYIESLWGTMDAPQYVVLIGDTSGSSSTDTTIPHWIGGGSKSADTDLPYVCMPGGIDWYPDISIGRLSVTSVSALQNVVNKTLFVENGAYPDPDYVKRGAFLANPDTAGLAEPTHDWVIDTYFTPNGYEGIKIYSSEGGGTADVTNAVNNGVLFCLYMGHSSSTGWWDPSYGASNINSLTNTGMYGFVFGWSCNTAHYSYDECFGETWLRAVNKGAAAYCSASNYIYWGSYANWLPSAIYEKAVFASFFERNTWEVGPAWKLAMFKFLREYGNWDGNMNSPPPDNYSVCKNFIEEFVLLGDPALMLPHPALSISFPYGLPTYIEPDTQATLTIEIQPGSETYLADSGLLYYRYDGGEFLTTPLVDIGGYMFEATLPTVACGDLPEFYVSAEGNGGTIVTSPPNAPNGVYSCIVGTPTIAISDNFETDLGWTTAVNGATSGAWERGVPINDDSWDYDPASDSDGSGQCYLTENAPGNTDVDGGSVELISPTLDMSVPGVTISYDYYFNLTDDNGNDKLLVEINNDDGVGDWIEIARHDDNGGDAWHHHEITQAELDAAGVVLTDTMKVRFTANDANTQSIVEAALDAFKVLAFTCGDECFGDLDGDNDVDLADLSQMLAHYGMSGMSYDDGDLDGDGDVDLSDLSALLAVYGTTCP